MINTSNFVRELIKNNLKFAAGVPDSLTKNLCFELEYKLRENHVSCSNEGSAIAVGIGYFLKERKVDPTEIARYGLGYCTEGIYAERIIVPSYDNDGILNYFTARSFTGNNYKYKNPPVSKDVIGFEFFVNWNEPIVLCEGPFDAMSIKRNAIPLFGKTIPKTLLKKIYEKRVKEIYIVLDEDAREDSIKLEDKLMKDGIKAYFVQLKDKDPNELGFKKVWNIIDSTKQTTFSDFIKHRLYG